MNCKSELTNFIDHYGLGELISALEELREEWEEENDTKKIDRLREFCFANLDDSDFENNQQ